jgi:hypothetical protein
MRSEIEIRTRPAITKTIAGETSLQITGAGIVQKNTVGSKIVNHMQAL